RPAARTADLPADADLPTLQAWVEAQARTEPPATFPDQQARSFLGTLHTKQAVSAHWPIGGRTPLEKVRALLQKVIRQYLRWLINPIVEQQNGFNVAATAATIALLRADRELRAIRAAHQAGQHQQ
ncbi:MAG: hypothetical protein HC914_17460, partial [Chloroflexaceae bacterium]|nr:hypothetical protein [Chloroflexaceae bacterium]